MKKSYLISLLTCCFILFCFNAQAAAAEDNVNLSSRQKAFYRWGEDVLLIAFYPYGWRQSTFGLDFEGVMFPLYLGYLSFDDQGEQKMIYFTPSRTTNTSSLENLCKSINRNRFLVDGTEFISIDDPDFDECFWDKLEMREIWGIKRLPLGTAKNFDLIIKEQTEFRFEEANARRADFRNPTINITEWGNYNGNFILVPKE